MKKRERTKTKYYAKRMQLKITIQNAALWINNNALRTSFEIPPFFLVTNGKPFPCEYSKWKNKRKGNYEITYT